MSKMSELHRELSEQASELGYKSIQHAIDNGYHVNYTNKDTVLLVRRKGYAEEEQRKAHEDYLRRKEDVLTQLQDMRGGLVEGGYKVEAEVIDKAIQLINEGES